MAPSVKAPGMKSDIETQTKRIESQMKDIVQNLYNLMVQGFDHQGPPTQEAMKREVASLVQNLVTLSEEARSLDIQLPPELISYVETSRNPDVYSREMVEITQRMNQMLKGRHQGYRSLRDTLAKNIIAAIPELSDDVSRVMATTGDTVPS